ncbi:MAG: hypothetical protein RIQ82_452 [Bacteroidota bacterium]|jgi:hypothetical protein
MTKNQANFSNSIIFASPEKNQGQIDSKYHENDSV